METIANIETMVQGLITGFGLLAIGIGILLEMIMLFCLPFFVYRIRKEIILIREKMTPDDTIELTDIVQ